MDYIYNKKYNKYKKKYLLLKQLIQEGGNINFAGKGSFGCLLCPPIKLSKVINSYENYTIPNFSFDKYNNCDYIGKILAEGGFGIDSYQKELKQFLTIKELDPNGKYTPQLIYANVYEKKDLQDELLIYKGSLDLVQNDELQRNYELLTTCLNDKIRLYDKFGYIISRHTGLSLESKYNSKTGKETDINKLKNFLTNFNVLLEFIKTLYDKNYLHLDIKMDNITVKEDGKLYLIDFGRFTEIDNNNYQNIIRRYLRNPHEMYSFEPKIYTSFMKKCKTIVSIENLITYVNNTDFDQLIYPYKIMPNSFLHIILKKVLKIDDTEENESIDIIQIYQKKYFLEHLNSENTIQRLNDIINKKNIDAKTHMYVSLVNGTRREGARVMKTNDNKEIKNKEKNISSVLEAVFLPIIKKYDLYCIGIVLAQVVFFNFDFDNLIPNFKEQFIELIKNLLFNKFDDVSVIISEIDELQKLI